MTSAAAAPMHRLFVGGCPTDLIAAQLQSELQRRFASFGTVTAVDLIGAANQFKGFAYVSLQSSRVDDCVRAFKGTKWRGQTFRVEVAKPDYLARILQQQQENEHESIENDNEANHPNTAGSAEFSDWSSYEYRFRVRPGQRLKIRAKSPIKDFPVVRATAIAQLPVLDDIRTDSELSVDYDTDVTNRTAVIATSLCQWKREVENRWLKVDPKPKSKSNKGKVTIVKTSKPAYDYGSDNASDSEDGGAVVEFGDDSGVDGNDSAKSTRTEEEDWAELEAFDGEGDAMSSPSARFAAVVDEAEEWAAMERDDNNEEPQQQQSQTEEADQSVQPSNSSSSSTTSAVATTKTKFTPSFPKKSLDWFDEDSEDDDTSNRGPVTSLPHAVNDEFGIRAAFEGVQGQQMLELKRKFATDSRFQLDERFDVAATQQAHEKQARAEASSDNDSQPQPAASESLSAADEIKRQLHDETVRSLALLDEVAPGPTKFHLTVPRFSQAPTTTTASSKAHTADLTKNAATVEQELSEEKARKSVLMWRDVPRFDPTKDTVKMPVKAQAPKAKWVPVELELEPHLEDASLSAIADKAEMEDAAMNYFDAENDLVADTVKSDREMLGGINFNEDVNTEIEAATNRWEVKVPRLRDLITTPSTAVSFSFVVNDDSAENDDATLTLAVTTNASGSANPLANVTDISQLPGARSLQRRAYKLSLNGSSVSAELPVNPPSTTPAANKSRLSDLLAMSNTTAKTGSSGTSTSGNKRARSFADSDSDEEFGAFVRSGDADTVQSQWKAQRESLLEDAKKKHKQAHRAEAKLGQASGGKKSKRKHGKQFQHDT